MRPDRPTSTHYTYIAMIDELDGVKQGALRVTGKGVDGCADKSNVLQYKILLVQKSNPKGAGFPTPLILAIVSSSTAVVRVLLWYSTRTNSIAPRRADTVRSELHTVAASRDGLIRRINMPRSTIVKYLAAVGFSLVLYQVPGTPWGYRTVVLWYCYFLVGTFKSGSSLLHVLRSQSQRATTKSSPPKQSGKCLRLKTLG